VNYRKFDELFVGFKNIKKARVYYLMSSLFRRVVYIPVLIALSSYLPKLLTMVMYECLLLLLILFYRPMKLPIDNIIALIN
jgi:hypothetical protein